MPVHVVSQGECVLSIATAHGLFWETVWDHPDNSDLRRLRADPNVLHEGDELFLPDLTPKDESAPTEQHHKFKRKGIPAKVRIRLMIDDQPVANTPYVLVIDGVSKNGTTDADGFVEASVPADAVQGELRFTRDRHQHCFPLSLGHLSPIDTDQGVAQRLRQLGYHTQDGDLQRAVARFQEQEELEPSGVIDDELRSKLEEKYGQ